MGYVIGLIDPTLLFSVYGLIVEVLHGGRRVASMSLPEVAGYTLLPSTRFNLTPYGAEHYLDLFLCDGDACLDAYGRASSTGVARAWGAGARLLGARLTEDLRVGGSIDVWDQPRVDLGARNDFDRPNAPGVSGAIDAEWRFARPFAAIARLGIKSPGYVMGQPLDASVFGYLGIGPRFAAADARP